MEIRMARDIEEELGQVFTTKNVAKLMVNLVKPYINSNSRILDPCIGGNVFFSVMDDIQTGELIGIEVDETLLLSDVVKFFMEDKRTLLNQNFFKFDKNQKFDIIIMNPPYVRQEKINGSINTKEMLKEHFHEYEYKIPEKSNLYIYFFVKALKHLKKTGILVAISYDSWLFTNFGKSFKKYLTENYDVQKIIHFSKGAFDNINVGASITLIAVGSQNPTIEFYSYDNPKQLVNGIELSSERFRIISIDEFQSFNRLKSSDLSFNDSLFTTMITLSQRKINRGTNAIVNKFFLFEEDMFPGSMTRIIKDVTKISKFSIGDEYHYLLDVLPEDIDLEVESYLKEIKEIVNKYTYNYKSLSNRIKNNDLWYVVNKKRPGNIIFNYYMRDNIHFIYNQWFTNTSDNFYNLVIQKNTLENLSILNSSFTKYALLKFGRMQGNGLFKIQLYEFIDVPVIDVNKVDEKAREKLKKLGEKLLNTDRKKSDGIINEIDSILVEEYNKKTKRHIRNEDLQDYIRNVRERNF